MEQSGEVDTAGDDLVPRGHIPGQGLAGEGGGVQGGGSLQNHAVQRHPLPGLDNDYIVHRKFLRVHLDQLAVPFHVGVVGADIHQLRDGLPGAGDSHALKQLPHLIEQHHRRRLGILPAAEGPDGGHRHEEVLVKDLAIHDVACRFCQNIPADDQVGDQKQRPPCQGIRPTAIPVLNHAKQWDGAG